MKLTFCYPLGFGINYCKNSYWRKYKLISRVQRILVYTSSRLKTWWRINEVTAQWIKKKRLSKDVPSAPFLIFRPANQVISSIEEREAKYLALVTTFPISWSQLETWTNFYQRFFHGWWNIAIQFFSLILSWWNI